MAGKAAATAGGLGVLLLVGLLVLWLMSRGADVDESKVAELLQSRPRVRAQDRVPLQMTSWTERELLEAVAGIGYQARNVFALGFLEQGDNWKAVGNQVWGIEAWGPAPGYGWTLAGGAARGPIGWAPAVEAGTGIIKPFVAFSSLRDAALFVAAALERKGFRGFIDYETAWNPGLPPAWRDSVAARWALGEQRYDELTSQGPWA